MPKDRERYRYIDVGLERGSWTLAMFEEDARRHQMSDQPGKLITLRLTEYYEMKKEREVISSGETLVATGNDHYPSHLASSEPSRSNESVQVKMRMFLKSRSMLARMLMRRLSIGQICRREICTIQ